MSYRPTSTSDLLAELGESFPIDVDDLEETGPPVIRGRLVDLIDALRGDPDAFESLPKEWRDIVLDTVHDYSAPECHAQATAVPAMQWSEAWTTQHNGLRYRIRAPKAGRLTKTGRRSLSGIRFCDEYGTKPENAKRFARGANTTARLKAGTYRHHGKSVLILGTRRGSLV